jgi:hypothetical protein
MKKELAMSKHETQMTRWYWKQIGGTLVEEFIVVYSGADRGKRVLDAIIIPSEEFRIARQYEVSIEGKDIVVVQTKAKRLGMPLLGQALFSAQLVQRFHPRSVLSVALCSKDDAVLRPLFEQYPGMKVVVCPPEATPNPPMQPSDFTSS